MKKDISIIIPAFNEENNIAAAVSNVIAAIKEAVNEYEIIVVNDGSTDRTGGIAEELAAVSPKIKVLHNDGNKGFGFSYRRGIAAATKSYVSVFPGDNDMSAATLTQLIEEPAAVDIVTSYVTGRQNRSFFRKCLSRTFVFLLNSLFGLHMKYFNGAFIAKLSLVRSVQLRSDGLTVLAECLVKLIKAGYSYKEIGFEHTGRKSQQSKALTLRSIRQTVEFIFLLINDIYLHPQVPSLSLNAKLNR